MGAAVPPEPPVDEEFVFAGFVPLTAVPPEPPVDKEFGAGGSLAHPQRPDSARTKIVVDRRIAARNDKHMLLFIAVHRSRGFAFCGTAGARYSISIHEAMQPLVMTRAAITRILLRVGIALVRRFADLEVCLEFPLRREKAKAKGSWREALSLTVGSRPMDVDPKLNTAR